MTEAERNLLYSEIENVEDINTRVALRKLLVYCVELERKWLKDRRKLRDLQQFARR